jgi:trimeric autotransporter adhesin
MKTLLKLALLLLPMTVLAQAPQIPLTGNIGSGFNGPLIYSPAVVFATDADHTMVYPEMSGSGGTIILTSTPTLTATRNLLVPNTGVFNWFVKNETTGGQTINVEVTGGTSVAVANGATVFVVCDGVNCTTQSIASGTVTAVTATFPVVSTGGTTPNISLPNAVTGPGSGATVGHLAVMGNTSGTSITDGGPPVPTGTGFVHVTSGSMDSAASAVNLGSADVTSLLQPAQGGSGEAGSITGLLYGNATSPYTQATAAQVVSAIGSTPVQNAYNVQCSLGSGCPNNNVWQAPWTTLYLLLSANLGCTDTTMNVTSISGVPTTGGHVVDEDEEEIGFTGVQASPPALIGLTRGLHGTSCAGTVTTGVPQVAGVVSEAAASATSTVSWMQAANGQFAVGGPNNPGIGASLYTDGNVYFGGAYQFVTVPSNMTLSLEGIINANCLGTDTNGHVQLGSCSGGSTGQSVTFAASGGASAGSSFNGASALTVDYHTIGASPLAGSTSLATLGTITTGVWNGTALTSTYLPAATVYNNQANAYTTGLQDFSAVTMKLPTSYTEGSGPYTITQPGATGTLALTSQIGSWGALNYPTWSSGTPFVKMTAAGTFALDTNTYLTSSAIASTSNLLAGDGAGNAVSSGIVGSNVALLNAANAFSSSGNTSFAGSVGIGTASPSQKLDVAGNINLNTNGTAALFSTFKPTSTDGYNLFIGGGGQSSVYDGSHSYTGSYNTSEGINALYFNTTGANNSAQGVNALYSNTTGANNSAQGVGAPTPTLRVTKTLLKV